MNYSLTEDDRPVIVITVYDRLEHIKKCLESLETADDSNKYHLIIGSDAPAKDVYKHKIESVRSFLREKKNSNSFKEISIIEHSINVGEAKNTQSCHDLAKSLGFKKFIRMEDDIVVGKFFLKFMNDQLINFENDQTVIAINGYLSPDLINVGENPFLLDSFSAYGFGSWYKKWERVQEKRNNTNYSKKIVSNFHLFKKNSSFDENAKSYPFLAEKFYKAADIEICLILQCEKLWVLLPPVSLTANRGLDGSGLRSGVNIELQSMEPYSGEIDNFSLNSIEKNLIASLKKKVSIKNSIQNWISFIVYNYLPYGFSILKYLRTIKKSL